MADQLGIYTDKLQSLAAEQGLSWYPVDFEVVPTSFMMEVAVYGLPVRMAHWSFGVRWIYQMVQHRMGHSKIFEVVFPGNPNRAYLVNSNSLEENTLVVAHVLGHADFSYNNILFQRAQQQVGFRIVEQAAAHARRIDEAVEIAGQKRVEQVLDAALALEQHIDCGQEINRSRFPTQIIKPVIGHQGDPFRERFAGLSGESDQQSNLINAPLPAPIPPRPESDLLWFIAQYSPDLEDWARDIILAVREESWYFQPVFNCQIMNEGWASHWHAKLLREADFLPDSLHLQCMKTHSDVVRPHAGDQQVALKVNPYHLGFMIWDRIMRDMDMEAAREIRSQEDDFSFVRNYLDADLANELNLFVYQSKRNGQIKVTDSDLHDVHEAILSPKYNFGAPRVYAEELRSDGSLVLKHDHTGDGRGLDIDRAHKVLEYMENVWHRPVELLTVDARGDAKRLRTGVEESEPFLEFPG